MNNFQTDISFSLDAGTSDHINSAYFKAFPHLKNITPISDLIMQKRGIDKVLYFENGNYCYVDEKIRRADYGDILLEEYSDFDKKKVGWLGRDKYTDYVSYIVLPTKSLYLLPFLILQKTYLENYHEWLSQFGRKFAENQSYRTSNIAVPKEVLLSSINDNYRLSL